MSFEINLATSFPFFKIIISLPSWTAFKYLEEVFKAERSESIEVPRGMVEKIRNFSPKNLGKITFKPETIKEEVC